MPPSVLYQLKQGGWTVSLTGRPCHSVGIYECHKMCINKDCKKYIIQTALTAKQYSCQYVQRQWKNLKSNSIQNYSLYNHNEILTIHSKSSSDEKLKINIKAMGAIVLGNMDVDHLCHLLVQKKSPRNRNRI